MVQKAAFKRLVERCGGVELCAAATRVSAAMISNYGNPNTDCFPPTDVVEMLEGVCGVPEVSGTMMRLCAPAPVAEEAPDWMGKFSTVSAGFGEVAKMMAAALADGSVSVAERRALVSVTAALLLAAEDMHKLAEGV